MSDEDKRGPAGYTCRTRGTSSRTSALAACAIQYKFGSARTVCDAASIAVHCEVPSVVSFVFCDESACDLHVQCTHPERLFARDSP